MRPAFRVVDPARERLERQRRALRWKKRGTWLGLAFSLGAIWYLVVLMTRQ